MNIKKYLYRSPFLKNFLMVVTGTLIAQIITIITSPILSRLYPPAVYGEYGVFTSITSVITVFVCLRYELAIILPEDEKSGIDVFFLSVFCCLIVSALAGAILFLGRFHFQRNLNSRDFLSWYYYIPLYVFITGIFTSCNYWCLRQDMLKELSARQIYYSIITVLFQLMLNPLFHDNVKGLLIGSILGLSFSTYILFRKIVRKSEIKKDSISYRRMWRLAVRYKEFPVFSSWSSLLNSLSTSLPAFMLASYFGMDIVGYYSLGDKILNLPLGIVSAAISKAFYPRIKASKTIEEKKYITLEIFKRLFEIGLTPFLLLTVIAPELIAVVFGQSWRETGVYIQCLCTWYLLVFISSPLSNLYIIMEKQKQGLLVNLVMLLMRFGTLYFGGCTGNARFAIASFGIVGTLLWFLNCMYILTFVKVSYKESLKAMIMIAKRQKKYVIVGVLLGTFVKVEWIRILAVIMVGIWFLFETGKNIYAEVNNL